MNLKTILRVVANGIIPSKLTAKQARESFRLIANIFFCSMKSILQSHPPVLLQTTCWSSYSLFASNSRSNRSFLPNVFPSYSSFYISKHLWKKFPGEFTIWEKKVVQQSDQASNVDSLFFPQNLPPVSTPALQQTISFAPFWQSLPPSPRNKQNMIGHSSFLSPMDLCSYSYSWVLVLNS